MTPTLSGLPSRVTLRTSFCAACASSVTLLRVNSSIFSGEPGAAPAGSTCRRTGRAGLAADELHDIIEAPADDVGERRLPCPGRRR